MIKTTFFSETARGACHKYRVTVPIYALNQRNKIVARFSEKWEAGIAGDDVFFFQRNTTKEAVQIIFNLAKQKRATIYDLDDDIFHIPETNPVYELMLHNPQIFMHQCTALRYASAVSVSCENLRKLYEPINPKVRVLPNCILPEEWNSVTPILRASDSVRIFWGGSPTHHQDLELLKEVVPIIKQRYGDKVEFVVMGEEMEFGTPILPIPFGPYRFFQEVMLSCQIGLAPMVDDLFNRCKSDLRLKELGAAGLAIVASPVGEYVKPDSGAMYCVSPSDWVESLSMLIEDQILLRTNAQMAKDWAFSWSIHNHIQKWEDLFEEMSNASPRRSVGKVVRVQGQEPTDNVPPVNKVRVARPTDAR